MKDGFLKTLGIILPVFIITMIIVLIILMAYDKSKVKEIKSPEHTVSLVAISNDEDWATEVELQVLIDNVASTEYTYSFDGGQTWSASNKYIVKENGTYVVRIKDIYDNIYVGSSYIVDNIDATPPRILLNFPDAIYLNDEVILTNYITAVDEESGIKSLVFDVDRIDTKTGGEKFVNITATDNADNISTMKIKINVTGVTKEQAEIIRSKTTTTTTTTKSTTTSSSSSSSSSSAATAVE